MKRLFGFGIFLLMTALVTSCTKDETTGGVDDTLTLFAGQTNGLSYYSNLPSPFENIQDSNIFEYDSLDIDIDQDNIADVAFVSVNHNGETYCEFKAVNPNFKLFADSTFNDIFVIKKYEIGDNLDQFHSLTSPNLFVTLRNSDIDINHWNGTENQYMAFSYNSQDGYIKGLGWIEVSISQYYNFTIHNWGVIEKDVRN